MQEGQVQRKYPLRILVDEGGVGLLVKSFDLSLRGRDKACGVVKISRTRRVRFASAGQLLRIVDCCNIFPFCLRALLMCLGLGV